MSFIQIKPFIKTNIHIVNLKTHIKTDYDFYIGRPSVLGNPYTYLDKSIAKIKLDSRDDAIESYRVYFYKQIETNVEFINEINKMLDCYKNNHILYLCCWCHPKPCHGEIIKKYLENEIRKLIYK